MNKKIIASIIISILLVGCATKQKIATLEDVEKHRLVYVNKNKVKSLDNLINIYLDKSQSFEVRIAALEAISETKHPMALEAVRNSVAFSKVIELELMLKSINMLERYDSDASVSALIDGLRNTENKINKVRESIIAAIGHLGSEDEISTLLEIYEVSKINHQKMNILLTESLGKMNDDRVIPILMKIANDEDNNKLIRSRAIEILAQKDSPEIVDYFLLLLGDPASDGEIKEFAYHAMSDFKEERMILALLESYQSGKNEYFSLLNTLINSMDSFEHPLLKPALIDIVNTEDYPYTIRLKALRVLVTYNDPEIITGLLKLLEDPKNYMFYDEIVIMMHKLDIFEEYKNQLRMASYRAMNQQNLLIRGSK